MKKFIFDSLKLTGTAVFLYIIFTKVDFNSLFLHLASANLNFFIYGFFIFFIMQLISTYRWYLLLAIHKLGLGYPYLFHANAASMLSGLVVPTNFGTDVIRFFYAAKKKGIDKKKATVGTLGDRAFGMFTMTYMLFFALLFSDYINGDQKYLLATIGIIMTLFFGYIFFKRRKVMNYLSKQAIKLPFGSFFRSMIDDISIYRNSELIKLFFISLAINLIGIYYNYILLVTVGASMPFILVFIAYPIKRFVSLLPISIGGIGVNEVTMWSLLSFAGVTMDQIIAYSALTYIILIASCFMYMLPGTIYPKKLN